MGWYVTCKYCGVEGKYRYECDCHEKQSEKLAKQFIGSQIVDCKYYNDIGGSGMCQHLKLADGQDLYVHIQMNMSMDGADHTGITEITKQQFESYESQENLKVPIDGSNDDDDEEF